MLTVADLETNVLQFRERSFQFERLETLDGEEFAIFGRTETETERQLRPKLVRLRVVVPLAWVIHDEPAELLRLSRDGVPRLVEAPGTAVEVAAERPEFQEGGVDWHRTEPVKGIYVYVPAELASRLSTPAATRQFHLV